MTQTIPDDWHEGTLGQRDAELLITYLTAPYLRIPLMMSFFTSGASGRILALASPKLQAVLDSCLFEPGAFRKLIRDGRTGDIVPLTPPKTVPHAVDDELVALDASGHDSMAHLATPAGLLFNELCRSPATVCAAVEAMLEFIVASDVGAWKKQHGSLSLFVLRLAVRVEEFALFILWNHAWRKHSESDSGGSVFLSFVCSTLLFAHLFFASILLFDRGRASSSSSSARGRFDPLAGAAADAENVGAMPSIMGAWGTAIRGVRCRDEAADTLRAWQVRVRERLDAEVFPMVERWCTVATQEKKARRACVLWAHLAYIYKATRDPAEVSSLCTVTFHRNLAHNLTRSP